MNKPPAPMAGQVRAVLERAGLTQVAIAEVLGIDQPAISRRYRGATAWRAYELQLLADRFDLHIADFYEPAEPRQPARAAS
jgi:predicted XRE-type DNA-binding protein